MNRRRFLKYAGATAATVGATALGLDYFLAPAAAASLNTTGDPSILDFVKVENDGLVYDNARLIVKRRDFVKVENDELVYDNASFIVKGFNYYPKNHAWCIFNDWDRSEVDYELQLGSLLGANAVRTFINYQYSTDNVGYQYDYRTNYHVSEGYLENMAAFLTLADTYKLKVIFSLFDYVYWELLDPNAQSIGEAYLAELIPEFANDPRILAWDVMNDPEWVAPHLAGGEQDVVTFLQRMSNKIKKLDSNHLITIGPGTPSTTPEVQSFIDFLCIHHYGSPNDLYSKIGALRKFAKPIVVEEWGKHTWSQDPEDPSDEVAQKEYYESILGIVSDQNISGSMLWTLMDFPIENNPCPPYPGLCFPVDQGEGEENHFGIYRTDYSPKPARDIVKQYYAQ